MINVTLSNVKFYFDKSAILTPAEKMQNTLLNKFGGTVRKTQRNSLKRGKAGQKSKQGDPPLRHSVRPDIKDTVFYFVDRPNKDVVIGMVLLSGKPSGEKAMPGVLEHSGVVLTKRHPNAIVRPMRVEARPSAGPAFEKTIKKQLPALIEGGIMREV